MEQIPYDINDTFAAAWWTPMTVYSGATYIAFTSASSHSGRHFLNVAKKDTSGKWLNFMHTRYDYVDDYGHNQTAIAVDGSGRIHVITGLHVNAWVTQGGHYFRSTNPEDITSWINDSASLPGQEPQYAYTYPIMRRHPSGDIYLIARRSDNISSAPMVLYKWTNATATWSSIGVITSTAGDNMFAYPDDMVITADGIVHIIYAHHAGWASPRRHLPSYINYNPSSGLFKTVDGVTRSLPILYTTTNLVYKGLEADETTSSDDPYPGQQSASLSMELGVPSIMFRHRETTSGLNKVRRVRWAGNNTWVDEVVYEASETSPAISHNISGDNIDSYFCALIGGSYKLHRYRKSISTGVSSVSQVSETTLTRLYQEGAVLYASSEVAGTQYLMSA